MTEGYNSSWGWLNHTTVNGTPTEDAQSVSDWIVTQSTVMSSNPSWVDVGNPVDFVPQSVKTSGNQHFQSLPSGTIGRVVIAGTAAATWEVYYPQGLLEEYNQVQDYGEPLNNMMNLIIQWGGTIEGGGTGSKPVFPSTIGLPITSQYGWREDPFGSGQQHHNGIDIGSGGGNPPIYATQSGIVRINQFSETGGYMVYIEHTSDPYFSRYLHLQYQGTVPVGETVTKGQQIGTMGTTGTSTGVHLHFEVATTLSGFGTQGGTIDPEIYLDMEFGDSDNNILDDIINLLLIDALAGWKW